MNFLNKYYNWISRLYDKKIDAFGLSIFRIVYGFALLCEVVQMYFFRHLIFDRVPFVQPFEIEFGPAMMGWMLVLILLIFGCFTRWMTIINYLFSLIFLATISTYEYHMCYVYMGVNFLLMFVNTAQVNSIDSLLAKLKYSSPQKVYVPNSDVSILHYYVLVLVSIAFFYFDSIFYKLDSPIWLNGLGMWLPASYPNLVHVDTSILLNSKWLVIFLGYATMVFETIFLFVFFRKKWRAPMMIIGVVLHIGIFIEFPIPWFALGVIGCYMLMVPVSWWKCLRDKLSLSQPAVTVYYSENNVVLFRLMVVLDHLDVLRALKFSNKPQNEHETVSMYCTTRKGKTLTDLDALLHVLRYLPVFTILGVIGGLPGFKALAAYFYKKLTDAALESVDSPQMVSYRRESDYLKRVKVWGIALFLVFIFYLQTITTYDSFLMDTIKKKMGFLGSKADNAIIKFSKKTSSPAKLYLGITKHALFMDYHFNGYNHIIGVEAEDITGKKYWLPLVDKDGYVDNYIYGTNWAKYTFRTNGPLIDSKTLSSGIRDFGAFWAKKHGFDPKSLKYHVYVKKVDNARQWEHEFLHKQVKKPWQYAGVAYWNNNGFVWEVKDIETF